jgi:two-component system OmpR family sensor kinase
VGWLVPRSQLSIRLWLQSTSFAAVLAGYALLVLANQQLLALQRQRQHDQRVQTLLERLDTPSPPATTAALLSRLQRLSRPELSLELASACPVAPASGPQLLPLDPVLISCQRRFLAGQSRLLVVRHTISAELAQERSFTLLLVAAAGGAALLTSGLMRLVLREGLRPLDSFRQAIDTVTAANLADQRLPVADQPAELRPIAAAFNNLLDRLNGSFEHQRTFVNAVAHELRTPITLIGGYANRLQRRATGLTPAQEQQLELIHGEASRMGRLVTDLIEIARSDAGQLEVQCAPLDAWAALVAVHQRLLSSVGPRLRLEPPPAGQLLVFGDGERLQQCLVNLIENAVKYAPANTPITLLASRPANGDQVVLHVCDHGPGVPEADKLRIFERFVRGSSPAALASPGSGIGLAVVHTLMQRMGGEALVCDAPGGGADFQLRLPALVARLGLVQRVSSRSTPSSKAVFNT